MTPSSLQKKVILDRIATIDELLGDIRSLPLDNREDFFSDKRNIWSAESCLRRSLEALFDIGRHILAKHFGSGVSEYKEIARKLQEANVLAENNAHLMVLLAGYRNRMVHYYHEISHNELFEICSQQLGDVETLRNEFAAWTGNRLDLMP